MQRLLEILLGLDAGFLAREGDLGLTFRPRWPLQEAFGAASWNLLLLTAGVLLVWWAYRRDGRKRSWKITLGTLRIGVLVLLIVLLNRPTLSLRKVRVEPGVVAMVVDTSASMQVADADDEEPRPRIDAALDAARSLAASAEEDHAVRLFTAASSAAEIDDLASVEATGESTDVAGAISEVARKLRGQNVAGIIYVGDGRTTTGDTVAEAAARAAGLPISVLPIGSPDEPANVTLESVSAEPNVFAGDVVNVLARVRLRGIDAARGPTVIRALDADGSPILGIDGQPVTATVAASDEAEAAEVELQIPARFVGTLELAVVAEPPSGVRETDGGDNRRNLRIDVLEADIRVLYVDGYPRWEYRYLKNRLIRDETIDASILLTSADSDFAQEGNTPIRRFPVSAEELQAYDVVLLGDVSPRQFSDGQLELIREFVGDRGGGFGMIAGPRDSPWSWQGTAIEALLPVEVVAEPSQSVSGIAGWRPIVTSAGQRTGIFRFFADREANQRFLQDGLREVFWFATGLRPKSGVGDVLAEHPDEQSADGRAAPILVAGRYGAGRTLFNGIDDSWRFRYYTGEPVFDTYWVQQLRYLARGRKLGERRATLDVNRPTYELGERTNVELRILDPRLATRLPDRVEAEVQDTAGRAISSVSLRRRTEATGGEAARFTGSFVADRPGVYAAVVSPLSGDEPELGADFAIELPRSELQRPATDHPALLRLASDTGGEVISVPDAASFRFPSAERRVPVMTDRSLWDAPIALIALAVLLTLEWVGRKAAGLI